MVTLLDFITIFIIYYHSEHSALLSSIPSTCIHVHFQVLGRRKAFVSTTREGYPFFRNQQHHHLLIQRHLILQCFVLLKSGLL